MRRLQPRHTGPSQLLSAWLLRCWQALDPYERALALALQPLTLARRMTVPDVAQYDRLMGALNTMLCPLLLLLFFNDFVDFDMPVGVFGEGTVPLWSVVALQSTMLAAAQWVILAGQRRPRWMEHAALGAAFVCSIAWISMIAQARASPARPACHQLSHHALCALPLGLWGAFEGASSRAGQQAA